MNKTKHKRNAKILVDLSDALSAEDVTGSQYHILTDELDFLVECGGYQGNNLLEDYRVNSRNFKCSPKKLQYIFLTHAHYDHTGLTPRMVKEGFRGTIYCPMGCKRLLATMWKDCAFINGKNAEALSKVKGRYYYPIYNEDDVNLALSLVEELPFNIPTRIHEKLVVTLYQAGHIAASSSMVFEVQNHNRVKKIGFTGDIGNHYVPKNFVPTIQYIPKCDILFGESTYGSFKKHSVTLKDKQSDLNKIKTIVEETCMDRHSKLLIPVFALDRSVEVLCELYKLYGNDPSFKIPVLLDSKLGIQYLKDYCHLVEGEQKELLHDVLQWKNLIQIKDYPESLTHQRSKTPEIVLASSGMMENGRIVSWIENYVSDDRAQILFCGYSNDNSLASILKEGKQRKVKIDGQNHKARIRVTQLLSFSSHASHDCLVEYYSKVNVSEKLVLVHGNKDDKDSLQKELQELFSKQNKSTRVINSTRDMCVHI